MLFTLANYATQQNKFYQAYQNELSLDDALKQGLLPESLDGVTKQADGSYAFSVDASDGHALRVTVDGSGGRCNILAYRYENAETWTGQETGTLWQGG
jgi:hypothetical protein